MARFLTLLVAASLTAGCASSPEPGPKAKQSKLHRFTFDSSAVNNDFPAPRHSVSPSGPEISITHSAEKSTK